MNEQAGPRYTTFEAAAHRAGHLLWPPLRQTDPTFWPREAVQRLWERVEALSKSPKWPTAVAQPRPTGAASEREEL